MEPWSSDNNISAAELNRAAVNAFNSLLWSAIKEGLKFHNVPAYLQRIIEAYFIDRTAQYIGKDGVSHKRAMYCGVPQGSKLGPMESRI